MIKVGENNLLVIHAMRLRDRYKEEYKEAKKWQK